MIKILIILIIPGLFFSYSLACLLPILPLSFLYLISLEQWKEIVERKCTVIASYDHTAIKPVSYRFHTAFKPVHELR